jgi:hypothetical protein
MPPKDAMDELNKLRQTEKIVYANVSDTIVFVLKAERLRTQLRIARLGATRQKMISQGKMKENYGYPYQRVLDSIARCERKLSNIDEVLWRIGAGPHPAFVNRKGESK